jgi:hypothetical protein
MYSTVMMEVHHEQIVRGRILNRATLEYQCEFGFYKGSLKTGSLLCAEKQLLKGIRGSKTDAAYERFRNWLELGDMERLSASVEHDETGAVAGAAMGV